MTEIKRTMIASLLIEQAGEMKNKRPTELGFEELVDVVQSVVKNWTGSTPCCGSIAYMVEDGKATTKINLFASKGGEPIKPTVIDLGKK